MTPERVDHIEFLSMINPTRGTFIFRAPPLSYISNIYYLPFAEIVWYCVIALVIISTFLIYLTFKITKENSLNHSDYFLFAISTVCQMGSHLNPKRSSGKIAMVREFTYIGSQIIIINPFCYGFTILIRLYFA